jgi:DNA polymerase III delta subunit
MRLKFWKNFKDRAVEFRPLQEDTLVKYIRKIVYNLSEESCLKLIEACEDDYGRILLELDKVIAYWEKTNGKKDENAIVDMFLKDGTIYQPPYDALFDFVAAVLDRNAGKSFNLLEQSYAVGESNMVLLSVLYTNIRTLLMVQSSKDYKKLGLNGFAVKNVIRYTHNYTNGELIKAMRTIREAEKGIKTGEMPDDISMQYVLAHIL